ncbi:cell wall hydrolase [Rhodobacter sp. TJ_12]|uniref:cell wall hydrolase n=1 Tax=Rhodobacter sp. TJ_12 TaxID=2029399 RepID=UPI001CBBDA87|nr:cell wall hydrolase [Rhodobacter sp. TJ_12]
MILLALASGSRADTTVSQSNDPSEIAEQGLMALLFQERVALEDVPAARVEALTTVPKAGAAQKVVWPWTRAKDTPPAKITAAWLASQPAPKGDAQFQCLANTLYHEARGEGVAGQVAVAEVVLNRVDDPRFPRSVCGVVHQSNSRGCQFSWTCDGRSDRIRDRKAWDRSARIARAMLDGAPRGLTGGATFFHTPAVHPSWARRFEKTVRIGGHTFYRRPLQTAGG